MVSIDELRQQTASARALAEQKKAELQAINDQLNQQEQALPNNTSQQALRTNFAGLQGRNYRQQIQVARENISTRRQDLSQYNQDVIQPFDTNVSSQEAQIQDYDAQQNAVDKINKIIGSNTTATGSAEEKLAIEAQYGNKYEKQYAKQALTEIYANRDFSGKLSQAVQDYNAGAGEDAFKGLNLDYLKKKGIVSFNAVPSSQEAQVGALNQNIFFNTDNIDAVRQLGNRQSRMDRVASFDQEMFPLVSASGVDSGYAPQQSNVLNWASTTLGNLSNDFRKQGTEVYSPQLGGFVSASPAGTSSSAVVRLPTAQEQAQINEAAYKGSFANLASIPNKIQVKLFGQPKFQERLITDPVSGRQYIQRFSNTLSSNGQPLPDIATKPFQYASEATMRAAEAIGTNRQPLTGKTSNLNFFGISGETKSPLTRQQVKGITQGIYTFAAFSPLINTGTAQQMESDYTEVTDPITGERKFIKKDMLRQYLDAPKIEGNNVNYNLNYFDKAERINKLISNLRPETYDEGLKAILKLAREQYGNEFLKEFMLQEGLSPAGSAVITPNPVAPVPRLRTTIPPSSYGYGGMDYIGGGNGEQVFLNSGSLFKSLPPNSGNILIGGNLRQVGKVLDVGLFPKIKINEGFISPKSFNLMDNSLYNKTQKKITPKVGAALFLNPKTGSRIDLGLNNLSRQTPKVDQSPKTNQLPFFDVSPDLSTRQTSRTRQNTQTRQNQQQRQRRPIEILRGLKIPKTGGGFGSKTGIEDAFGFNVFVRRKGKDIFAGKASNAKEAGNILFGKLKGSLAASGFVTQGSTGQKVKLDLWGSEFKQGKNDMFKVVQQRGYRLGTGSERAEIKASRRQKTANWFGSSKKSKSKKIRWF